MCIVGMLCLDVRLRLVLTFFPYVVATILMVNKDYLFVAGFNPVWHDTLEFKVRVPQLAFVVFTVFAKNLAIAHYAAPYHCVQQGQRDPFIPCYSSPRQIFTCRCSGQASAVCGLICLLLLHKNSFFSNFGGCFAFLFLANRLAYSKLSLNYFKCVIFIDLISFKATQTVVLCTSFSRNTSWP